MTVFDPARPTEITTHGKTVSNPRVEAAINAFYSGDTWQADLGTARFTVRCLPDEI